ncbi:MAG: hypothetical protein ACTSX1_04865 [Candidatus Heimdallarchaeaceae archaeon]
MMIAIMICSIGMSYGQNDSLINEFETKNMLVMSQIVRPIYNFKVYNDSLVQTITGGFSFKQYKKKNIPVKSVFIINLQDISQGDVLIYKFENNDKSIQITFKPNGKAIVLFRTKDSFSGAVSEIMYY